MFTPMNEVSTIFFDIGDTLGTAVVEAGRVARVDLFPRTRPGLEMLHGQGFRLGVISNTGEEPGSRINELLQTAEIRHFFEENLLIYSRDVGMDKSSAAIFALAAQRAEEEPAACLFVGENVAERSRAAEAGLVALGPPLVFDGLAEGKILPFRLKQDAAPEGNGQEAFRQWSSKFRQIEVDGEELFIYGGDQLKDREQLREIWTRSLLKQAAPPDASPPGALEFLDIPTKESSEQE